MDKERIAHRFAAALGTYDKEASEQRRIARTLTAFLTMTYSRMPSEKAPSSIIEFGCGTGLLSAMLKETFNPSNFFLNDLCTSVSRLYKDWSNTVFIPGDAESLVKDFASKDAFPKSVDLIATSSVVQWFEHPTDFLLQCAGLLKKDGILAVAVFGPSTFRQIKFLTGQGLTYPSLEDFIEALSPKYKILIARQEEIEQTFSSPKRVLEHLKHTGVTGVTTPGREFRWTRQRLQKFAEEYIRNFPAGYVGEEAVKLTYQPIYLILQKKD